MTVQCQPAPDGNLPEARQRLRDAINELIDPRAEQVNGASAEIPSLFTQLYDAIPGAQGTGHSAARSLPPLWIDAARLVAWIDTSARKWQPDYDRCRHCKHCQQTLPAVARLALIRKKQWRPQDTALITGYSDLIDQWLAEIKILLTPQPIRALWAAEGGEHRGFAACPACDKTMAKKRDNAGEEVGTPALQLMNDGSTHCLACKTTWGPEQAMWVCRMLGYPLPDGVLQ